MSVILAMLLDALLGEPKVVWSRLPHPAILMGRAVAFADTRLNHGPWVSRWRGHGSIMVSPKIFPGSTAPGAARCWRKTWKRRLPSCGRHGLGRCVDWPQPP